MDGFGLAQWVRAHWPETAVILSSGVAKIDDAAKHGIAAELFLQKPYDLKQLVEQISDLTATRH
jgi:DNA-binding NtrC family response regulator